MKRGRFDNRQTELENEEGKGMEGTERIGENRVLFYIYNMCVGEKREEECDEFV